MTNTKKILAIALAVILIASVFTACGNKDKPVASETTSNTVAEETTESTTEVTVPPIETDETGTQAETTKSEGKAEKNQTTKKATQTTKKATASGVKKPSSTKKPTTTKKPAKKPTTTKKPSNPTKNTYAYFTASTGEKIRYCTYSTLTGGTCTGIHESNGRVIATYNVGANCEWVKCSNCGKYLCEGCQPESDKCPYCGKVTCERYSKDSTCLFCHKPVKAETCHDCPNSPRR